jgi:hypothetical protein
MRHRLPYPLTMSIGFPPAPPHPDDIELHRLLADGFYEIAGRIRGDHRALIKQRIVLVDRCVRDALVELIGDDWLARSNHLLRCGGCAENVRRRATQLFLERATPDIAALRYRAGKPDQR